MRRFGVFLGVLLLLVIGIGKAWAGEGALDPCAGVPNCIKTTTDGATWDGGALVNFSSDDPFKLVLPDGGTTTTGIGLSTGTGLGQSTTGASGLGVTYGYTGTMPNKGGFYQWPPGTNNYYPIQIGVGQGGGGGGNSTCPDVKIDCATPDLETNWDGEVNRQCSKCVNQNWNTGQRVYHGERVRSLTPPAYGYGGFCTGKDGHSTKWNVSMVFYKISQRNAFGYNLTR